MNKLKQQNWRYLWMASFVIIYAVFYAILVRIFDSYHNVVIPFDAVIPFNEWFVLPYVTWYIYIVLVLGQLFFKDKNMFIKTAAFIGFGAGLTLLIGIVYPNTNDLRPVVFEHRNLATWIVGIIYTVDPPRMVLPSIHVYYTVGLSIGACCCRKEAMSQGMRWFVVLWGIPIILSTVFIKQHSIVDAIAAFGLGAVAYIIFFRGPFARWIDEIEPVQQSDPAAAA